jgi:hypothetical protein
MDPIRVHRLPMTREGGSSLVRVCAVLTRLPSMTTRDDLDPLTPAYRKTS